MPCILTLIDYSTLLPTIGNAFHPEVHPSTEHTLFILLTLNCPTGIESAQQASKAPGKGFQAGNRPDTGSYRKGLEFVAEAGTDHQGTRTGECPVNTVVIAGNGSVFFGII